MLIKSISQNSELKKDELKSNFFLGDNFGNPLFIGHTVVEKKEDIKIMHNHFKVASSFIQKDSTIYVFNRSKNTANFNILKELTKMYKEFKFENLNI